MDVFALTMRLREEGAAQVKGALYKMRASANATAKDTAKVDASVKNLGASFKGLAGTLAATFGARELIRTIDTYSNLTNQLKLVTNGTKELAQTQSVAFRIAQETRQPFEEIAGLYAKVGRASAALGVSQAEVAQLTRTVGQALVVSGSSGAAAAGALTQLAQALAAGTVRAEEFNSIQEGAPALISAVEQSLGLQVGQLRKVALEGRLSSREFVDALLRNKSIADDFAKTGPTIAGAFTTVRNELVLLVGKINEATGITNAFVTAIKFVKDNLAPIIGLIGTLTAAYIAYRGVLITVAAAEAVKNAMAKGIVGVGVAVVAATTATGVFLEITSRLNAVLKDMKDTALPDTTSEVQKTTAALVQGATEAGPSYLEMLTELAGLGNLTRVQVKALREEEARLNEILYQGNIPLAQKIQLLKERASVQAALAAQAGNIAAMESAAAMRMAGRVAGGGAVQAEVRAAPIIAFPPGFEQQIRDKVQGIRDKLEGPMNELNAQFREELASGFGSALSDGIAAGFDRMMQKGASIGDAFKALTGTILSGLGSMLIQFGTKALIASKLMAKLLANMMNPTVAVPAALAMIALGAALRGAGQRIFSSGGRDAGGAITAPSLGGMGSPMAGMTGPQLLYGPTAAGGVAQIGGTAPVNVTIIGPNDPSAQRAMQELIANANRRGNTFAV